MKSLTDLKAESTAAIVDECEARADQRARDSRDGAILAAYDRLTQGLPSVSEQSEQTPPLRHAPQLASVPAEVAHPAPCGLAWRSLDTDHNRRSTTYTVQVEWDVVLSDDAYLHRLSVLTVRCHDDDCENQETALLFGEMPAADDIAELTEDVQRMHEERSTCYRDERSVDWRTAKQVVAALEAARDARGAA